MPLDKYYSGHGGKVMASMKKTYGAKKGKEVFYKTANKRKTVPLRSLLGRRRYSA